MWKWKVKQFLASEYVELLKVILFGIVLYSVDVITDLQFVARLIQIKTNIPVFFVFFIIPFLGLSFILLPGLLMALQSISKKRIDLYYSNNAWIKLTWKTSPLLLPYFIVMPIWGVFVPLTR